MLQIDWIYDNILQNFYAIYQNYELHVRLDSTSSSYFKPSWICIIRKDCNSPSPKTILRFVAYHETQALELCSCWLKYYINKNHISYCQPKIKILNTSSISK